MNNRDVSRNFPTRGAPAGLHFIGYALVAVGLMYLDQRGGWLDSLRYGLQAAAYPVELALNSPGAAWQWTRELFVERETLQSENLRLRNEIQLLQQQALRRQSLERENAQLRQLTRPAVDVVERWLPAQVISTESNRQRQRLTIDRGAINGVEERQTVVAGPGLLGQTLRVGPWSSEIILITDPEHAVPVEILRTGVRTLAVGTGQLNQLDLPFLPLQTDIEKDDVLVTSGLGGVFPAGYPVAVVTEVRRDGGSPLARVDAKVLAEVDRHRVVSLLWFRSDHPAAPSDPRARRGGDPAAKALAVTAQPDPPQPAARPAEPAARPAEPAP